MNTPCVNWTGSVDRRGYGKGFFRGKWFLAHRAAWMEHHGDIPEGMTIDHLCFNPPCVNVEHLRLLSRFENTRNQRSAHKTHCVNGHEFTPENTYSRRTSGGRDCRACIRARVARYQAKRRAAA